MQSNHLLNDTELTILGNMFAGKHTHVSWQTLKSDNMKTKIYFITLLLIAAFTLNGKAQVNGSNDHTFNPDDIGFDSGAGSNDLIGTMAIQTDGKIVIGGKFTSYNGTFRSGIARLNADGSLDTTFNPGTGIFGPSQLTSVRTIAIQPDGKIVIGGYFSSFNGTSRSHIVRLNADGSLDTTFNVGTGASNSVETVSIQADGKIIIGGSFVFYNGTSRRCIARLNTDGSLDPTFNPGTGTGSDGYIITTAIQADGKIVIGGDFNIYNGTARSYIARINSDGSLDNTFNVGTVPNYYSALTTVVQPDGKIVVGGSFPSFNGIARNNIARFNTDGSLDGTFDSGTGTDAKVRTLALQTDGKIVIGGDFYFFNGIGRNGVARINTDGSLDTLFNAGLSAGQSVMGTALQLNGKIVIGGNDFFGLNNRHGITRLNTDSSLDTTFNPNSGANSTVYSSAIQSDGKIIICGTFNDINGVAIKHLARLNTDGSLDTTFNTGTGPNYGVSAIAIQPDQKIIIGGQFNYFNGTAINYIVRLNTDGSIDPTLNVAARCCSTVSSVIVNAIAVQSDGKIIIGGTLPYHNGTNDLNIMRLHSNGSVDNSFNVNMAPSHVNTLSIQPDGKIIYGGEYRTSLGVTQYYFGRLNTNGSVDYSFIRRKDPNNSVRTTAIQSDGKIIVGGWFTTFNETTTNSIYSINTDGSLDSTFNSGIGADSTISTISIQPDGKMIIGGSFSSYDGTPRNNIARLNVDGSLDATFNPGIGADNTVYTTAIQSNGNIVIGGSFTSYNAIGRNRIARISQCDVGIRLDVQMACNSFVWIDGNTYTASTTTPMFPVAEGSTAGCDSIVRLNLTINATSSIDSIVVCDSLTWIDGITYTSNNNIATFSIPGGNSNGCDSLVTLDLTIINSSTGVDTRAECDSLTWIDGITYTSNNNIATFSIPGGNSNGCDSLVTLDLTISSLDPSYTYTDNGNGNYSFTNTSTGNFNQSHWAFGDGTIDSTTNINHTFITNGNFTVVLTVNDSTLQEGSCVGYYLDTINVTGVTNPLQCNSGFVIYPDTTENVTIVNNATGNNLTYLWDFGDGNTSVLQNPNHTYATAGPFYLCLTIDDGSECIDMYCDSIGENGIIFRAGGFTINVIPSVPITTRINNHIDLNSEIEIFPNPTSNRLTIDTELKINEINIIDISGKTIKAITTDLNIVNVVDLSNGIYFIKLITEERTLIKKFVKR